MPGKKIQRIIRQMDVCENCGGVDTFRKYARKRSGGGHVDYLRCKVCGQIATCITKDRG